MNNNLNYYLIKLIQLNKKTSTVYFFIIFILLFICLGFNCYFITELYNNLDKFVDLHINSRKKCFNMCLTMVFNLLASSHLWRNISSLPVSSFFIFTSISCLGYWPIS